MKIMGRGRFCAFVLLKVMHRRFMVRRVKAPNPPKNYPPFLSIYLKIGRGRGGDVYALARPFEVKDHNYVLTYTKNCTDFRHI